MDRMKQMDDEADKSVLKEIIDIMGKMNGQDMDSRKKSYVEVKLEQPVDMEAGDKLKAEDLPGEDPSEVPETIDDENSLQDALNGKDGSDDEENDYDSDNDLRRKARIF